MINICLILFPYENNANARWNRLPRHWRPSTSFGIFPRNLFYYKRRLNGRTMFSSLRVWDVFVNLVIKVHNIKLTNYRVSKLHHNLSKESHSNCYLHFDNLDSQENFIMSKFASKLSSNYHLMGQNPSYIFSRSYRHMNLDTVLETLYNFDFDNIFQYHTLTYFHFLKLYTWPDLV